MLWVLAGVAVVAVVLIGFLAVGRETGIQAARARPAVFDLEEAVAFIADQLPAGVAGQVTLDDVRWVLRADVDLIEDASLEGGVQTGARVLDEDAAAARILAVAEEQDRRLSDDDIVAILRCRLRYLGVIGAVGPEVKAPEDPTQ